MPTFKEDLHLGNRLPVVLCGCCSDTCCNKGGGGNGNIPVIVCCGCCCCGGGGGGDTPVPVPDDGRIFDDTFDMTFN